jgi:hypothetical protein
MATLVNQHELYDLSHKESTNEILLRTQLNTELHIIVKGDETIITFPFGNKFDFIDGVIVIRDK